MQMRPTRKMIVDNTPAKIGRLMKKVEKFMADKPLDDLRK